MLSTQIEAFHTQLNHPDVVSPIWYRRNHQHYALICYVNVITGLYMSHNYNLIPLFLNRAYHHIHNQIGNETASLYHRLVLEYLSVVATFLLQLDTLTFDQRQHIPAQLIPPAA